MVGLRLEMKEHGAAWITLARAEKHNALDDVLIAELTSALERCADDTRIRSVVLAAEGASFSAGADLAWMRRSATQKHELNVEDARALGKLMYTLDSLSRPTIALVQGPAYGGGLGLIACCDIALAVDNAKFSFSEVRLGLIPAVIAPYAVAAIGARACRRYFQTAEVFDAAAAQSLGLVHEVMPRERLEARGIEFAHVLAASAPGAKAAAKRLIAEVAHREIDAGISELTARAIADARASDEAKEGIAAFFENRKARWS